MTRVRLTRDRCRGELTPFSVMAGKNSCGCLVFPWRWWTAEPAGVLWCWCVRARSPRTRKLPARRRGAGDGRGMRECSPDVGEGVRGVEDTAGVEAAEGVKGVFVPAVLPEDWPELLDDVKLRECNERSLPWRAILFVQLMLAAAKRYSILNKREKFKFRSGVSIKQATQIHFLCSNTVQSKRGITLGQKNCGATQWRIKTFTLSILARVDYFPSGLN